MAKWIYNRPYECCSAGELEVAKVLARLDDSWLIRWGYYYDSHREGDFLILGPTGGILVLEVKGGDLRKLDTTGRWEGPDQDHPLTQLLAEWNAVIQHLGSFSGGHPIGFVNKALCLPGITIDLSTARFRGIDRGLIVDRRDLADFVSTWRQRLFDRGLPVAVETRTIFTDAYAADITPKALRHFVSETDRILLRHRQGEYEILEMLDGNRQLFVEGGPGTGKTWLALEQAYRFAAARKSHGHSHGQDDGQRVLLLCYNLALAGLLGALVAKRKPACGEVVVLSWEGLARELFASSGLSWDEPEDFAGRGRYFTREVPALMQQIVEEPGFAPRYDALVVDEAQDHDTVTDAGAAAPDPAGRQIGWWETYFRLLVAGQDAPMAIFYDAGQRPVFRGADCFQPGNLRARLPNSAHLRLVYARRYSRPVFEYLKTLSSETTRRLVDSLRCEGHLPEGPAVETHSALPGQTSRKVTEIILRWIDDGLCRTDQILILAARSQAKSSLSGCHKLAEWPLVADSQQRSGQLSFLSVRRAKGLDSLAVILIDFPPFDQLPEAQDKTDFFMGASRARQLLAVVHPEVPPAV